MRVMRPTALGTSPAFANGRHAAKSERRLLVEAMSPDAFQRAANDALQLVEIAIEKVDLADGIVDPGAAIDERPPFVKRRDYRRSRFAQPGGDLSDVRNGKWLGFPIVKSDIEIGLRGVSAPRM